MQRLTKRLPNGVIHVDFAKQKESVMGRLASIEDILGDEYDLDGLRELLEADRNGRYTIVIKCHECKYHGDSEESNWCKFWHKYCPIDPDFYCKAALKIENNK